MPLMAESEALVLSSDFEGYPAVAIEALGGDLCHCQGLLQWHPGNIARPPHRFDCEGGNAAGTGRGDPRLHAEQTVRCPSRARFRVALFDRPIAKSYLDLFDEVAISGA